MNNKYIKILSKIIVFLCLLFIVKTIISLNVDFRRFFSYEVLVCFLASTIIVLVNIHLAALIYKRNVDILSETVTSYGIIKNVYIKSNIGKYLPGNVMHFAGRNIIGSKYGIDQRALLFSTILMLVQTIVAATLIGIVLNIYGLIRGVEIIPSEYTEQLFFPIALFVTALILASIVAAKRCLQNKKLVGFLSRKKNVLKLLYTQLHIIAFLIVYAISFLVVTIAFSTSINIESSLFIISAFIIAWICGTMVPGAPGGLGVREAVLLALLSKTGLHDEFLLSVIFHRLSTTFADIAAYLITKLSEGKIEKAY